MAGIVGEADCERSREGVLAMMASLCRRGPDGEGLHQWASATLGHRRLAIFDLSAAGRQPMTSADGRVGVVFNGAIYNFPELRAELERCGKEFRSRTDTEVLVHGYQQWGLDALVRRLRGMFAIGLWDNELRKLFLVRDRLGVKPLLYVVRGHVLFFASTARALRAAGVADAVDPTALVEYLEFGFVSDERCIFAGVHKVLPGTIVEWDGSGLTSRAYWSLPRAARGPAVCFQEVVEETERLLLEAVKIRLHADVPVGALLSGGIDSSLVCWAGKALGANIASFTVSTPESQTDESTEAAFTARKLEIPHRIIELGAEETPAVEDLASAYGEPFACASALGILRVSRAVKSEATVLLTGDGGDDVFLGYPYHRYFFWAQRFAQRIPSGSKDFWLHVRRFLPDFWLGGRIKHFVDYATGGLGAVIQTHNGLPLYERFGLLGDRIAQITLPQRQTSWSLRSARNLVEDFLMYDWRNTFSGEYMTKVDGGTMYYGLEARSPFLDHVLWDYAGALPLESRLRGGQLKAILREIVRRRIGVKVASRAKQGFEIPVRSWLAKRWAKQFLELFNESLLAREKFIQKERVLALWRQTAPSGGVPIQLWHLFVLEHWMRAEMPQSSVTRVATPEVATVRVPDSGSTLVGNRLSRFKTS